MDSDYKVSPELEKYAHDTMQLACAILNNRPFSAKSAMLIAIANNCVIYYGNGKYYPNGRVGSYYGGY